MVVAGLTYRHTYYHFDFKGRVFTDIGNMELWARG